MLLIDVTWYRILHLLAGFSTGAPLIIMSINMYINGQIRLSLALFGTGILSFMFSTILISKLYTWIVEKKSRIIQIITFR